MKGDVLRVETGKPGSALLQFGSTGQPPLLPQAVPDVENQLTGGVQDLHGVTKGASGRVPDGVTRLCRSPVSELVYCIIPHRLWVTSLNGFGIVGLDFLQGWGVRQLTSHGDELPHFHAIGALQGATDGPVCPRAGKLEGHQGVGEHLGWRGIEGEGQTEGD